MCEILAFQRAITLTPLVFILFNGSLIVFLWIEI